jgi:hypothetical protein
MADNTLAILRQDAIRQRIKGIAGGNRIVWSTKDTVTIRDYGMAMPETVIRGASTAAAAAKFAEPAEVDRKSVSQKFAVTRDMKPDDFDFLFTISSRLKDLADDVVYESGIDCTSFNRNAIVTPAHDTSALPIATSTAPWVSGQKLMAVAKFPKPGISAASDQVAAAIRGGLVRGASIGFVPIKWSFSTDPARPFGVDFHAVKLLEWACCSLPCNGECLLVGAVSAKSANPLADPAPTTREQRVAEANKFRRIAYS